MKYFDCFRAIARHRTDEIVVASAGKFLPGVVGGDARLGWQLLSRRLDEPLQHVCLGYRAGAAGTESLGVHG